VGKKLYSLGKGTVISQISPLFGWLLVTWAKNDVAHSEVQWLHSLYNGGVVKLHVEIN